MCIRDRSNLAPELDDEQPDDTVAGLGGDDRPERRVRDRAEHSQPADDELNAAEDHAVVAREHAADLHAGRPLHASPRRGLYEVSTRGRREELVPLLMVARVLGGGGDLGSEWAIARQFHDGRSLSGVTGSSRVERAAGVAPTPSDRRPDGSLSSPNPRVNDFVRNALHEYGRRVSEVHVARCVYTPHDESTDWPRERGIPRGGRYR